MDPLRPLWIAASELISPEGELQPQLLEGFHHNPLSRLQNGTNGDGECFTVGPVHIHLPPGSSPRDSLADLVSHSRYMLRGEVVALDQGFYRGRAGTLLRVQLSDVLKSETSTRRLDSVLVFYPEGRLEMGAYSLCAVVPGTPPAPSIGDEVLVFEMRHFGPGQPMIFAPQEIPIFIGKRDGRMLLPEKWRGRLASDSPSLDSLVTTARELLRQGAVP